MKSSKVLSKFHVQLGIPEHLIPAGGMLVRWTGHAVENWTNDHRFNPGTLEKIKVVNFSEWDVIEVKTDESRKTWKEVLVRRFFSAGFDVCLVLTKDGAVKTTWFQASTDMHKSLDESKYIIP